MKAKQIFKIILFVVLFVGVVAYITYAMLDLSGGDPKEICTELSLVVEENPHADFINAQQLMIAMVEHTACSQVRSRYAHEGQL